MKRAFITGITGQDGSYLTEYLLGKGYEVYGLMRRSSVEPALRLEGIKGFEKVTMFYGDLRDSAPLEEALRRANPGEVYNLAAQSHIGVSFKIPQETFEINYAGVGRLVEAIKKINPSIKLYQALSSEVFSAEHPPHHEESAMAPVNPYAEAKIKSHLDFIKGAREKHNMFAVSGFLFNHESPRRGKEFVTRKITLGLSRIKEGLQEVLELGNLNSKRDWGFAGDYVRAMHMMLQQENPEDYVISSGEMHSVREFVLLAAKELGITITFKGEGVDEVGVDEHGKVLVRVNPSFFRPVDTHTLFGDSTKARTKLGWKPEVSFPELVSMMVKSDHDKVKRNAVSF